MSNRINGFSELNLRIYITQLYNKHTSNLSISIGKINDIIPRLTNFCLGKCSLSIKNTLRRLAFPIGKVHKIQLHPQFSHARKCIGPNFHFVFIQNYYPNAIRRKSVCKIFALKRERRIKIFNLLMFFFKILHFYDRKVKKKNWF